MICSSIRPILYGLASTHPGLNGERLRHNVASDDALQGLPRHRVYIVGNQKVAH